MKKKKTISSSEAPGGLDNLCCKDVRLNRLYFFKRKIVAKRGGGHFELHYELLKDRMASVFETYKAALREQQVSAEI